MFICAIPSFKENSLKNFEYFVKEVKYLLQDMLIFFVSQDSSFLRDQDIKKWFELLIAS